MNTSELIRTYRKKCKMTQEQLASKCGTSAAMIRQYESGKRNPKIETLQKISTALGVSLYALSPNSIIFDTTPVDCEINDILKKAENGEALTSEESMLLRAHIQQGVKRASEVMEEMVDTLAQNMLDSIPLAVESGRKVLEDGWELRLISYYNKLNPDGKKEAVKRMEELTHIPSYTDEPPTE